MGKNIESKYKVGDRIYWYCDDECRVHSAKVQYVNIVNVGFPEINYEVEAICCGINKLMFIDEFDVLEENMIDEDDRV